MYIIIGIVWFVLDQLTKQWVQASFTLGESLPVIPNVFHLTYILNKGAGFMVFSPVYFKRRCLDQIGHNLIGERCFGKWLGPISFGRCSRFL